MNYSHCNTVCALLPGVLAVWDDDLLRFLFENKSFLFVALTMKRFSIIKGLFAPHEESSMKSVHIIKFITAVNLWREGPQVCRQHQRPNFENPNCSVCVSADSILLIWVSNNKMNLLAERSSSMNCRELFEICILCTAMYGRCAIM